MVDRVTGEHLLDVVALVLILIEEDMHLIDAPEEVVEIPHDVLIGAGEENAEVVGLAGSHAVDRECLLHVLEIDELGHLSIGVAGDVHQRAAAIGNLVETMDRHDREELSESPVIEQRLKDREIAQELVGQRHLKFANLFGDLGHALVERDDLCRNAPVEGINLGLGAEIEQAEVKHRLRLVADLLGVVKVLQTALFAESRVDFDHVGDKLWIAGRDGYVAFGFLLLDRTEGLDNEHRVRSDDEATALAHDHGMLDLLRVADLHDVVDDVAGVFVQAVIARAVEAGTGSIVVHAESAADIEVAE